MSCVQGPIGGLVKGSGRRNTERSAGGCGPAAVKGSCSCGIAAAASSLLLVSHQGSSLFSCCSSIAEG